MGCQSSVELGNNLTFSICTHDPDTGVLTDADANPAYRIYEDETAVAILTGTMTKLDDANTAGFYTELVACTAGNGFEAGRSYTIYITATVDADTGGIALSFGVVGVGVTLAAVQPAITWAAQTITTAGGDALTIAATGANGDAVSLAGNGTGAGMKVAAGATGYGVQVSAGGSNGVQIDGGGGGNAGVEINGPGTGLVVSGTTDYGISATGGLYGQYNLGSGAGSYGQYNSGQAIGQRNTGSAAAAYGQYNDGGASGQGNVGTADYGQSNVGGTTGSYNNGTAEYGIQAIGGTADTDPDWTGTASAVAALVAYDLDHLIQITAGAEEPTIGSYLDQIMNKDGGQTFNQVTDSLEALGDALAATTVVTVTGPIIGSTLTIVRGDTLTAAFTGLGNISTRTKLWLTIKSDKTDADTSAAIQVLASNPAVPATDGLQRLNGSATTAAYGSLTVVNAAVGDVTLVLTPAATAVLRETARYYDIQMLTAAGAVTTLTSGDCDINLDVTAAIA